MDHKQYIKSIYDFFYRKVYKNNSFSLDTSNEKTSKLLDNFVKVIASTYSLDSVGINFLIAYFSFAFHYWSTKTTKRKIQLNWIMGKKTFDRWVNRKEGNDYWTDKWLSDSGIDLNKIIENKQEIESSKNYSEEIEKVRFKENGQAQLYHCLSTTTLYDHRSKTCMTCKMKSKCKGLLKTSNLRLYKKRGYNI